MSRGLDWFDAFREIAPEWSVVLLGLVTQLGDVWFLGLLVGTVYLTDVTERDEAAGIVGITLAGLSLITGLKDVFELPRPDRLLVEAGSLPGLAQPLYEATTTASGFGFPSGHALMSTIVYLSLAEYWTVSTRLRRYAGATVIVTVVCLSRVGLGVHYLVDVVVGVGVGLAFLFLASGLLNRYPSHRGTLGFGLAVGVAALSLIPARTNPDAILLFGASLGAFAGWQLVVIVRALDAGRGPIRTSRSLTARAVVVAVSSASLLALTGYYWPAAPFAGSGVLGLAVAAFVTAPVLFRSEYLNRRVSRSLSGSQ